MDVYERTIRAKLVKPARNALGWSRGRLAEEVGLAGGSVSVKTLQNWENGHVDAPHEESLRLVLEVLGVDLGDRDEAGSPEDVEQFIEGQLRPLLRRLSPDVRAEVMPVILELVIARLPEVA